MSSSGLTVGQVARKRLAARPLKQYTLRNYLQTIRLLGLEDVPFEDVSVAMLHGTLQAVLNKAPVGRWR